MSFHITRKEKSETKGKSGGRKLINVLLIITLFVIIIRIITFIGEYKEKQLYNNVLKEFDRVCNYVINNRQAFETLSEYEISVFDESSVYSEIKVFGEYQEERDIVFSCAKEGCVRMGKEVAVTEYLVYSLDRHFIRINCTSEPVYNIVDTETCRNISPHISISLHEERVRG